MIKRYFLIMTISLMQGIDLFAQCAMCKTTVVNNVSHGELSLAGGLNFGITYLFTTPYLIIIIVGFLWYRKSKQNKKG